ncbi:hypothetical protein ABS772_13150 [Methylorubrum podarium]|uniref:Uncharacterized protein n=1 Tax=Methylorubrum podarium TaxID=200476 RepID=A0ABV1QN51_9HYPH
MTFKRKSDCTPEEWERYRAEQRERQRKYRAGKKGKETARLARQNRSDQYKANERARKRKWMADNRDRQTAYKAQWAKDNPDKASRHRRKQNWRRSSPKLSRRKTLELMVELRAKAPRHSGRDEIIAAATMFVLEGDTIEAALAKSSKAHNADIRIQKSSTNFEEAYWL